MRMTQEEIRQAYRTLSKGASLYDGMMTCSTFWGKVICRLVWNMGQAENSLYLHTVFSALPDRFSGRLLEVPVGTGVLTMPIYRELDGADVTCLDYSSDMMAAAQNRASSLGLSRIRFLRGDVGALPFQDESFDAVLSMNGFHAFPDKEAAYRETLRVLKPGGVFCGCFYIRGETRRTDWFVRHFYEPKGFFTPPYETPESLKARLEKLYKTVTVRPVGSIACFAAEGKKPKR